MTSALVVDWLVSVFKVASRPAAKSRLKEVAMGKLKTLVSKSVHFVDRVISSVAVRSMLLYTGWGDQLPHAHAYLEDARASA